MPDGFEEQSFDQKIDFKIWAKLARYALRYKGIAISLIITLMVTAAIDLLYPLLSRFAIDNFIIAETVDGLGLFAVVYAASVLIQGGSVFLFVSLAGKLEMNISYTIRQDAFKKLQELSFSYYDTTAVGYIMARMVSDIARLSEMLAWSIVDVMWALAYVIGVLTVLFVLNYKLALLVTVVLPPLVVLSLVFQKKILKYQRRVRKTNSKITGAFNEGIMGAVTSKTLVREKRNMEEFGVLTGEMRTASIRSAVLSAIFMPLVMFLGSVGTGLVLWKGGNSVVMQAMSFGTFAAFISYTSNFFEPVQQLARIFAEFQSAQASAERVMTMIETPCEIEDSDEVKRVFGDNFHPNRENWPEIKGDIEFSHVSFAYKGGEKVLEDFNLKVRAGETIALVGETGAGKSTIVNLLCRFYEPTEGRILIDGVDYRERSQLWLQSSLGYVLQSPHLFSCSIRDNIRFGRKDASEADVVAAARTVSAESFIDKQESGYDTMVGEGGVRLSTGEKQLISFARVVLADPRLLVLDEATSSIDTETEQLIQNAIGRVLENRTSFIVAHRLSTIRSADRILVIRDGRITESGTHRELLALKGYYYDLYTNQFREEASSAILA